ncbi:hypothetical protein [Streptomyces sp. HF10]|uniref:hypothetical protein n=1 Tax=Streptomyces sp. HF10 TaxID=2692233 RepID=UPI00131924B5|nr:hypothetical protein [Streptomyces sp. HF10]QHC28296.1 hypothetical protein GR129_05150 [Streptomyces sp. HF10]
MPGNSAPGDSLPGDWDGGWRRVAPPSLTVARATLGVSDGLTFRDGLTSWQNPAFDAGLGHGLLPSAPMGLVHGVTRPAVQRLEYGAGGPLLLRSLPVPGGEEAGDGEDAGPALAQVQRVVRADGRGAGEIRRPAKSARPQSPSSSPGAATHAVADGAGRPSGPELPVVRRVAVVPNAPGAGTAPQGMRVEPGRAAAVRPRPLGPSLTVARRVATGPVRRVASVRPVPAAGADTRAGVADSGAGAGAGAGVGAGADVVQRASAPGRAAGRAPLGEPMAELPSTATPLAVDKPSRSVTADVPPPSGPALPVVQRRVDTPEAASGESGAAPRVVAADVRPDSGAQQPPAVQRRADGTGSGSAGARTASGPLLPEVRRHVDATGSAAAKGPETSRAAEAQPSAGPVLPVVQRQAEAPGSTGTELPAVEAPKPSRAAKPSYADKPSRAAEADAPTPSRPLLPEVQRLVDAPGSTGDTRPATPGLSADGAPEAPRVADAPPAAGPVLPVVQRRTDDSDVAQPTTKPLLPGVQRRADAPAPAGGELPAAPVLPAAGDSPAPPAPRAAAEPVLPVVQRQAEAPDTEVPAKPLLSAVQRQMAPSGSADKERPATAPGAAAAADPTPRSALPVVQRQTDASAQPGATTTPATQPGATATPATRPGSTTPTARSGSTTAPATRPSSTTAPTKRSGAGSAAEGPVPARRAERTGPSGARARGGLGAPLSALPPTAAPRGPAGAGGRPAQPYVQRVAAGQDALRASMAPLLGTASPDGPASASNSPIPKPASAPTAEPAPATPLVTRAVARPGASATDTPGVVQRAVPTGPAAPGRRTNTARPVVVARALAEPRRTVATTARSLLSARPLTLNTRAPEGMPRPPRTGTPGPAKAPVVAASWRREPAPEAARPATPGAPPVQRAVTTRAQLPVVRPDTPVQRARAGAALPLTEAQAPPLQASPAPASLAPPGGLPVPVVRMSRPVEPTPVVPGGVQVDVVQRDARAAAPGRSAHQRPRQASAPVPSPSSSPSPSSPSSSSFSASSPTADRKEAAPQDPGVDLEDLARRLLDPLARLLRADMRRGRERAGRPYDGRR